MFRNDGSGDNRLFVGKSAPGVVEGRGVDPMYSRSFKDLFSKYTWQTSSVDGSPQVHFLAASTWLGTDGLEKMQQIPSRPLLRGDDCDAVVLK